MTVDPIIDAFMRTTTLDAAKAALGVKFLQAVHASTTDATVSVASLSFASFLTASITPKSATSRIIALGFGAIGCSHSGWGGNVRISRASTGISVGAAAGSRRQVGSGSWYSGGTAGFASGGVAFGSEISPGAGASVTYSYDVNTNNAVVTAWRNRSGTDVDGTDGVRGCTNLLLLEVEP